MNVLQRIDIKNLSPEMKNITVVGLIVGRNEPKYMKSTLKQDNVDLVQRGVVSITIRDCSSSSINCALWGSARYIQQFVAKYSVDNVVSISYVTVSVLASERFLPTTSSPFLITATEGRSQFQLLDVEPTSRRLQQLRRTPLKPLQLCLNLADVAQTGSRACDELVDVLGIVRQLKPIREIRLKNGSGTKRMRELVVMDKSHRGVLVTLWNEEHIMRSESWLALESVIHLIDVKIGYSTFYRAAYLIANAKTLIMDHLNVDAVWQLREYVISTSNLRDEVLFQTPSLGWRSNIDVDPSSIRTVLSCQNIVDRMTRAGDGGGDEDMFTAVAYGVITKFNVDDNEKHVIKTKCCFCKKTVKDLCVEDICINMQFQMSDTTYRVYDIVLDITDHSGTLPNCHLMGSEAEKTMTISPDEFGSCDERRKCDIKWKWFMERCRVKMVIHKRNVYRPYNHVRIVELAIADYGEVVNNVVLF